MAEQLPMFAFPETATGAYPEAPGWKEPTTSKDAAESFKDAASIREQVLDLLSQNPSGLTPDEAAAKLHMSVLSVRPRFSELARDERIVESGVRRLNVSGREARVWVRTYHVF